MSVSAAMALRDVLASEPPSLRKVNAAPVVPSSGDISPVWKTVAFRRSFPAAWAQYLKDNYRTAYAVEKAFSIDSKTARDWINGKRDPSGSFVAAVVAADPNAIKTLGRME